MFRRKALLGKNGYRNMKQLISLLVALLLSTIAELNAATILWTNTAGGNWNAAANWSPNAVPGLSDTAVITNAGTYSVAVNAAVTVAGLELGGTSGTQTLTNGSLTLTLNGPGTVSAHGVITQSGGTTTGTGSLSIAGSLNWSGGTMGLTGGIANSGTATISGGGVKTLTGQFANAGQLN